MLEPRVIYFAGETTPPPLRWCHYIHSISTCKSAQCNQQTQHHKLRLDDVTIYAACQHI